jgi:hypothetical protein
MDPGCPKTCHSGSGSPTLVNRHSAAGVLIAAGILWLWSPLLLLCLFCFCVFHSVSEDQSAASVPAVTGTPAVADAVAVIYTIAGIPFIVGSIPAFSGVLSLASVRFVACTRDAGEVRCLGVVSVLAVSLHNVLLWHPICF